MVVGAAMNIHSQDSRRPRSGTPHASCRRSERSTGRAIARQGMQPKVLHDGNRQSRTCADSAGRANDFAAARDFAHCLVTSCFPKCRSEAAQRRGDCCLRCAAGAAAQAPLGLFAADKTAFTSRMRKRSGRVDRNAGIRQPDAPVSKSNDAPTKAERGMWKGRFVTPRDWRAGERQRLDAALPVSAPDCAFKPSA